jgi:hypothetical protein
MIIPVCAFKAGQRIKPSAHSVITNESIRIFEQKYSHVFNFKEVMNKKSFQNWLNEGVIDADGLDETDAQDQDDKRYLNHFYESSLYAKSSDNAIYYVFEDPGNAYGWNKAVRDYRLEGNRHLGIYRLGQCLHVLQDMACPAHTRKDQQGIRNLFDNYSDSRTNVPDTDKFSIPQVENVQDLFKILASFSHSNFFSENTTIKSNTSSYTYPAPEKEIIFSSENGNYKHVQKKDINGMDYSLGEVSLLRKYTSDSGLSNPEVPYILSSRVLKQYYDKTAPKAAVFGTAFLRIFFNYAATVLMQVKQSELHTDSLILRWEKNLDSDFMCYEIFRSSNGGLNYSFIKQINSPDILFLEERFLTPGVTYRYLVKVRFLSDHVRGVSNYIEVTTPVTGDNIKPEIINFTVLDQENIELMFSESINKEIAENLDCYSLSSIFDLPKILSARLENDMRTVKLKTSVLVENDNCTLLVRNITDISGNMMETATFNFSVAVPLLIASAEALTNTSVKIIFSEPLSTVTAENASNYTIYPDLTVYSADLKSPGNRVDIVSDPQEQGGKYTVTVKNITALDGSQLGNNRDIIFTGKE